MLPNSLVLVDWAESRLEYERIPDKRPEGDAYHLWRTALHYCTDSRRVLRRWTDIREYLEGNSLVDLGAGHGLFVACAKAEGLDAYGLDRVDNRAMGVVAGDIFHAGDHPDFWQDNILLLDVWPYMVQDAGWDRATEVLRFLTHKCNVLFFESQLYGDGPGPEAFKTDAAVESFLSRFGSVTKVVSTPIEDRNAFRTVFAVRHR